MDLDNTIATHAQKLADKGVPGKRAEVKAEGTAIGGLAVRAGLLLCTLAATTVIILALMRTPLTFMVALVVGVPAALGLFIFGVGMSLISREASDAVAKMGEWLINMVRSFRGKNGA